MSKKDRKAAASHGMRPQQKRKAPVTYGKHGMTQENELNDTIPYHVTHERAVNQKKPTPKKKDSVDYPQRRSAKIKEAYFKTPNQK
ncbi:Holliday junction resolvase RecU, partial [Listeria monocytogenes]|uniref:Holliday junction resolvase RecU n=1 Tax=Listeria monocytogenes TaxID=1639 RepID=UPI001969A140